VGNRGMVEEGKVPHKDPHNYTLFDWAIVSAVALWAALSAYLRREFRPQTLRAKAYFLTHDLVVSGGTTYLVYMASVSYGMNDGVALFLAGFAGTRASRFSYMLEAIVWKRLGIEEEKKEKKDG